MIDVMFFRWLETVCFANYFVCLPRWRSTKRCHLYLESNLEGSLQLLLLSVIIGLTHVGAIFFFGQPFSGRSIGLGFGRTLYYLPIFKSGLTFSSVPHSIQVYKRVVVYLRLVVSHTETELRKLYNNHCKVQI